ncbi:MAG: UDP-N-acetylmuramoyl-L-alanyl-D-glutamate--2,6-diaminopimelate ligase [Candidatus Saccharimonadales bacterium]
MNLKKLLKKIIPKGLLGLGLPAYHSARGVSAAYKYGFPAKKMKVIGVTGTNGKTTTAAIIASILEKAGYKVGLSTTAYFKIGEKEWVNDLNMTSTNPYKLQRLLAEMAKEKVEWAVVEVTSHALKQHRVWGIPFQAAVMTNLTQDHLDYHGSMQAYAAAKAQLLRQAQQLVVLNIDDEWFNYFNGASKTHKLAYGTNKDADVRLTKASLGAGGSVLKTQFHGTEAEFVSPLVGKFNAYNTLAAITLALGLDINKEAIAEGLKAISGVPGRMEKIDEGQNFNVLVDYAHTPDAIEKLFESLKPITKGKIIAVFGATGDRDKLKRPIMGEVAAANCDIVIITDDEPYSEDAGQIRASVLAGAQKAKAEVLEVGDRKEAIKKAFALAENGDVVTVLGMGHQTFRTMNEGKIEWDDRAVARELLKNLANKPKTAKKPKKSTKKKSQKSSTKNKSS